MAGCWMGMGEIGMFSTGPSIDYLLSTSTDNILSCTVCFYVTQ